MSNYAEKYILKMKKIEKAISKLKKNAATEFDRNDKIKAKEIEKFVKYVKTSLKRMAYYF